MVETYTIRADGCVYATGGMIFSSTRRFALTGSFDRKPEAGMRIELATYGISRCLLEVIGVVFDKETSLYALEADISVALDFEGEDDLHRDEYGDRWCEFQRELRILLAEDGFTLTID